MKLRKNIEVQVTLEGDRRKRKVEGTKKVTGLSLVTMRKRKNVEKHGIQ